MRDNLIGAVLLLASFAIAAPIRAGVQGAGVEFSTDFECGLQHPVRFVGGAGTEEDPAHFEVTFPGGRQEAGFFLFRLDGVAGKSIRVDMKTDRARHWHTLNPVFAYIDPAADTDAALADPELFLALPPPDLEAVSRRAKVDLDLPKSLSGTKLPLTKAGRQRLFQHWHFMGRTGSKWASKEPKRERPAQPEGGKKPDGTLAVNLFRVEHTFSADAGDSVVVAMKVPYTPKLADALMRKLQAQWEAEKTKRRGREPDWEVVQIGVSAERRPLWMLRIGEAMPLVPRWGWGDNDPARNEPFVTNRKRNERPVILIYAREHADEHDTSWVAWGAAEFLLSDHPDARAMRRRCTFLIIPLLDPDGAVRNQYETDVIRSFEDGPETKESLLVARRLRWWVDSGNRLDLVFNLHNVESGEGPHLFQYMHDPGRVSIDAALHKSIMRETDAFEVAPHVHGFGTFSTRLGGWLRLYFGSHMMFYEVNSQAPKRHLSLYELKALGVGIARGAASHLFAGDSKALRAAVEGHRRGRYARWDRYGWLANMRDGTVFELELRAALMPHHEESGLEGQPSRWVAPLYRRHGHSGPPEAVTRFNGLTGRGEER